MTNLAVLLTCYNRKTKTLRCLQNLFNQQSIGSILPNVDVYLTDDASTDGTSKAVKEQFPQVNLIKGTGSLFWNRGMHLAWDTAAKMKNYDFYLWLNDDTFLFQDAIEQLISCSKLNNKNAIICGFLCSENNAIKTTYGGRFRGEVLVPNGKIQEVDLINGNVVLVPKAVFQEIGNLDVFFPHAIGDYDYGLRAIKKGFKLLTSTKYIGTCELNQKLPSWCYKETPLFERMKSLYSPLGNANPTYFFVYEFRHFGLIQAIKHFISIHLRMLFPSLWKH